MRVRVWARAWARLIDQAAGGARALRLTLRVVSLAVTLTLSLPKAELARNLMRTFGFEGVMRFRCSKVRVGCQG